MIPTRALALILPLALIVPGLVRGAPAATPAADPAQPPVRIILVGDSTMAVGSGYGPGFFALANPATTTCVNLAKGGRSSGSYRAEGSWTRVMDTLRHTDGYAATYVLIQFGHNDQPGKPGRSTDLHTQFPANMRQYVRDVRSTGAHPVLVTPLTRRSFRHGKLADDLGPWADATRTVGREEGVPVLELNAESAAAIQRMGPAEANTLAMAPPPTEIAAAAASGDSPPTGKKPDQTPQTGTAAVERPGAAKRGFDYTHLGPKGSAFFGRMVADELGRAIPELATHFRPSGTQPAGSRQ